MRRIGLCAAAKAIGKDRKTVAKWKKLGAPFFEDGSVALQDLIVWAEANGHLERGRGRPTELQRLADAMPSAPAPAPAPAAPTVPDDLLADMSADDREALETLMHGTGLKLAQLASQPELLKRLALVGRTRKELADAQRKELENKERRGDIVAIGDVRKFWSTQIAIVKRRFQALPGKLAPKLVGQGFDQIHQELERELQALLVEFAQEIPA